MGLMLIFWSPYQLNRSRPTAVKDMKLLCCRQKKENQKYSAVVSVRPRQQDVRVVSDALGEAMRAPLGEGPGRKSSKYARLQNIILIK